MNTLKTSRPAMSKHLIGPHPKQQRKILAKLLTRAQVEANRKEEQGSAIIWTILFGISFLAVLMVIYRLKYPS